MLKEEEMGNNWWRLERIAIRGFLSKKKNYLAQKFFKLPPQPLV